MVLCKWLHLDPWHFLQVSDLGPCGPSCLMTEVQRSILLIMIICDILLFIYIIFFGKKIHHVWDRIFKKSTYSFTHLCNNTDLPYFHHIHYICCVNNFPVIAGFLCGVWWSVQDPGGRRSTVPGRRWRAGGSWLRKLTVQLRGGELRFNLKKYE